MQFLKLFVLIPLCFNSLLVLLFGLETIDGNYIGPNGAKHIANVISNSRSLTFLHLGGNIIKDEGAVNISLALAENKPLIQLDLSIVHSV